MMWIPSIEVESAHGARELTLRTRHLMSRRVFLTGEINEDSANDFLQQLLYLEEEKDRPIDIYINSPGGQITAGLMIYDALQGTELEVNTYCTGMAASMAAVLLAGGQKGRRYILPHSKVMIHEPLIQGGAGGSASSVQEIAESILETRDICNGILAKHTGKTLEEMNKVTAHDHYMKAEEAVKFGICDKVVTHVG